MGGTLTRFASLSSFHSHATSCFPVKSEVQSRVRFAKQAIHLKDRAQPKRRRTAHCCTSNSSTFPGKCEQAVRHVWAFTLVKSSCVSEFFFPVRVLHLRTYE